MQIIFLEKSAPLQNNTAMVGKIILRRKKTAAGFTILFLAELLLAFNLPPLVRA
jgi:hypothetical protein